MKNSNIRNLLKKTMFLMNEPAILKNIKLNKDQQKIFDFINDLPMNKSAVVLLTGTAGSGKTTLSWKSYNEKKGNKNYKDNRKSIRF